jgi:GPH family glycoside/pentoside/hexuronide:cation symporter
MSQPVPAHQPLPKRILFYFGLTEMPVQVAAVPLTAYVLNYFVQDLGVSASLAGLAYLAARIFDMITDPLIGHLSDRTKTRWGRRRVWMAASLPFMLAGSYMLFFPQPPVSALYFFIWMCVLWLGWTMLVIPYYAWAAELSPDYHERSLITGWRTALGLAANVISKLIPALALVLFAYGGTQQVVHMIGVILLILLPITVGLTVMKVGERQDFVPSTMPLTRGLRVMWRNGPFKRLIFAFFINYIGTAISTATIIFFVRGVVGSEDAGIIILLAYYLSSLCSIPFWVWMSKRISKHKCWIMGLMTFPLTAPFFFLLGPGDVYWMIPLLAINGFGGGTFHTMTNSMKADVIDLDTAMSGENRAGLYFSIWAMAMKVSLAIGPWLALSALGFFGFESKPGLIEDPQQKLALQCIYILSPPLFFSLTAAIAWRYPITEQRHLKLRDALRKRRDRRTALETATSSGSL